jgi:hypothetical protein
MLNGLGYTNQASEAPFRRWAMFGQLCLIQASLLRLSSIYAQPTGRKGMKASREMKSKSASQTAFWNFSGARHKPEKVRPQSRSLRHISFQAIE